MANLNPKQTRRCNQSSLVRTLKGTAPDTVLLLSYNPKSECTAAISLPWYEPKRTVVCNQSSQHAKTLKVHAALQSVFLGTNPNARWYAISLPTMLKPQR